MIIKKCAEVLDRFEKLQRYTKKLIYFGLIAATVLLAAATAARALGIYPMGYPYYTEWITKTAMSVFAASVVLPLMGEFLISRRND